MKVVVRIIGGLGNQMFIYATARALALRIGADLILDTKGGYKNELFNRVFLLDSFNIPYQNANRFYSFNYWQGDKIKAIGKRLRYSAIPLMKYFTENSSHDFVDGLLKKHTLSIYLEGYWQNESYFNDFASIIKEDFQFPKFDDQQTLNEVDMIKQCATPIAIGVRRYQELTSHQNTKVTDLNFYLKAIDYIESQVNNPTFFIFSEDQEWVKNKLGQRSNFIMISPKEGSSSALNDMYLISLCKHHIVSNSSFYWWGAWLASNKNKIVVASDCFLNPQTIPDNWIKL